MAWVWCLPAAVVLSRAGESVIIAATSTPTPCLEDALERGGSLFINQTTTAPGSRAELNRIELTGEGHASRWPNRWVGPCC